ncbi:MAG TPA: M56 family metallopeptidase [Candidatus Sulfotelmatobacter sp.]|nr:M56 family metallopeptidase [Candidatus Sulfotelmatobacter sp.]
MTSGLHAVAELVTLRFLESLAEGAAVCLLVAVVLRLVPRQNASTRFAVWFSVLVTIVALPWLTAGLSDSGLAPAAARRAAVTLPSSWALYLFAAWGIAALWFAVGLVQALWHLNVLRSNSVPVGATELDLILRETLGRPRVTRRVVLCTSDRVRVPTAIGLFKPTILIPAWVMREFSAVDLSQIVLHELAHFRRWDDWTNLAQQLVKAIFFFHPAVWWLDRQIALEREMACDDAVLAQTRRPRAYAECLAQLAEKSFVQRTIALAQAALGKVRQTSARIAQILDVSRPAPTSRSWGAAVSLVAVLALGCGALYSRIPGLVAFGTTKAVSRPDVANLVAPASSKATIGASVPVVQAEFIATSTSTKLTARESVRKRTKLERGPSLQFSSRERDTQNLLHVRSTVSDVPVTETFWVVVEREATNRATLQVYQIQMWRVTVLRKLISPSRQVPRSQI